MNEPRQQLRVVTIAEPPYTNVLLRHTNVYNAVEKRCNTGRICWKVHNNVRYEPLCCVGYMMDMLDALENDLIFDADLYIVEDEKYGEIVNGSWVGLVGDVVSGKADIILASLNINGKRADVVDFSLPFLVGGMAIVTILETENLPFANIEPFKSITVNLWIAVIVIPIMVVFLLIKTDKSLGQNYHWRESFTYVTGLVFQRDMGGKNPTNWSSKVISLSAAMFLLVIMSTYTAVLTANNVTFKRELPITGFNDDLISNPTKSFRYGTLANSAYTQLFGNSEDLTWNRMARFMKEYNFTNTTRAFEQLASGEINAIIQDYYVSYYNIAKDPGCRFKFAGESIKDGGAGIAVPKGSPLAEKISQLIIKYQDEDFFLELQAKWMENQCLEISSVNNEATKIGKEYFGGLFIGLGGAAVISCFILLAEVIAHRWKFKKVTLNNIEK